jgi:Na+/proline symporter
MSPLVVFLVIATYFGLLILISQFTSKKSDNQSFFTGNRKSPWYLVAFGMIGASLSGVTFISVPGDVGNSHLYYFQMVLGYLLGYFVIAAVLLPIYYKLNLVSIYEYLKQRFGFFSHKTGAAFFLLSRVIGASFRLFLVATVLQIAFFGPLHIPFAITVAVTIMLIWVYTFRSGIKTIVYTDIFQTTFMLLSLVVSIIVIAQHLNINEKELWQQLTNHPYTKLFNWDWKAKTNFFKQFFAGAFITIVMTGLDQDMMQKNLTVKTLRESQKNMFWFSLSLVPVNLLFMSLGVLLYIYAAHIGIEFSVIDGSLKFMYENVWHSPDDLFPIIAINQIGGFVGIAFLIGIIAAAFSSADSALTALTTSFSIDMLNLDLNKNSASIKRTKMRVHIGFSILLFLVILGFKELNNATVIKSLFTVAGYTYGPLLGLYAFGIYTKRIPNDKLVPIIALLSPILTYIIGQNSAQLFWGYKFGFELLIVNGLITFLGIFLISKKRIEGEQNN